MDATWSGPGKETERAGARTAADVTATVVGTAGPEMKQSEAKARHVGFTHSAPQAAVLTGGVGTGGEGARGEARDVCSLRVEFPKDCACSAQPA